MISLTSRNIPKSLWAQTALMFIVLRYDNSIINAVCVKNLEK